MIRELLEDKPYIKKIVLGILAVIVLIILISVLLPLFKTEKLTFSGLENKMKQAAIEYYQDNKELLPQSGGSTIVTYSLLQEQKLLKSMDKYLENNVQCSGQVVVKNNDGNYSYTPYLNCGDKYTTIELYKKVLNDNELVTQRDGLYMINDMKVFRGEKINNYVSFANRTWRILRIENDNTIKLLLVESKLKTTWDNRYNSEKKYNSGKNNYNISRLKESIDELYNNSTFLSNDDKAKLVAKNLCIGSRNKNETNNTGDSECKSVLENQYIGVISLYEYINASIDEKCQNYNNNECQNYNYLTRHPDNSAWWTITPVSENTYEVYQIGSYGNMSVVSCSSTAVIRPTVYLSSDVMYSSGTGTADDPYVIK